MREALPPYDLDAEEAVLGSCLIDSDCFQVLDIGAEDFFSEQNQYVFGAIRNIGDGIDQITVAQELARMNRLDEAGGAAYLSHLVSIVPTSLHAKHYEGIVKKCAFNRRLCSAAGHIESIGYKNGDPSEATEKIHKILRGLELPFQDNTVWTPSDLANSAFNFYSDQKVAPFIQTGIKSFDKKKGGYLQGEYVLIVGRTTLGKTTIALQQACHIAETMPDLFISLEMSKAQVSNKNIARYTGIDEETISLKRYDLLQRENILAAIGEISKLQLFIAEGNRTMDSIRRLVDKQMNSVGCGAVFVDYMGRIKDRSNDKEHLRIGHISKEFGNMAKEYKIPFIVLHQFSRDIDNRLDHTPRLSDCREGGEEDADLVVAPFRVVNEPNQVRFYILKDRLRGKVGYFPVNYDSATGKYS
jgi:replicative DNA helicase